MRNSAAAAREEGRGGRRGGGCWRRRDGDDDNSFAGFEYSREHAQHRYVLMVCMVLAAANQEFMMPHASVLLCASSPALLHL